MTNRTTYQNWKEFFNVKIEASGKYALFQEVQNQYGFLAEKYVPVDGNDQTIIKIGYLYDELLYLKFENPISKGFNKQQEIEYFYRYDFTAGKSYGEPGLEFIKNNIEAIEKQLKDGLRGKEIQFFKNGEHVKSKIYMIHNDKECYPNTVYFQKRSFWQKLSNLFSNDKLDEFKTKEINLKEIFKGI